MLLCDIQARQCGSHMNATKDQPRISRAAPLIHELLQAPEIHKWSGKCPAAQAAGICSLGGVQSYQDQLWNGLAAPRERRVYDAIAGKTEAPSGPGEVAEAVAKVQLAQLGADLTRGSAQTPPQPTRGLVPAAGAERLQPRSLGEPFL